MTIEEVKAAFAVQPFVPLMLHLSHGEIFELHYAFPPEHVAETIYIYHRPRSASAPMTDPRVIRIQDITRIERS